MQKIILSTNNVKKLSEIKTLLRDLPIKTIAQSDLNIGEAEEPYGTFLENALTKARFASKASNLP
ncbi:MAG: non-canonical purine NTP pyrophosphatase, partial [Nitrosomonadales bacterium]|nr:non-canonical purine NTP pyrophosphatase [Nitrosomonadales bacterium]